MTLEKYRILHSTLIEQYQYIEFDLEGLYAAISGKPFPKALEEIEKDAIGRILKEIRQIERDRGITVFSKEDYQALLQLCERRNFWCHACYTEPYNPATRAPRNGEALVPDLKTAQRLLARVRQVKSREFGKNQERIIKSLL